MTEPELNLESHVSRLEIAEGVQLLQFTAKSRPAVQFDDGGTLFAIHGFAMSRDYTGEERILLPQSGPLKCDPGQYVLRALPPRKDSEPGEGGATILVIHGR